MANIGSVGSANSDWYIESGKLNSHSIIQGKGAEQMSMDDFFSLLVAQMTNQDMMNPTADTEYIAQMAQFTTLRGIQVIQEYQLSSYASSYAGKTVAIAHTSENGNLTRTEGVVESVTFYDGEPKVVVNGVSYPLYSVMEVKSAGAGAGSGSDDSEKQITPSQAATFIGKTVTVQYTDSDDAEIKVEGEVTAVKTGSNGQVLLVIDGNEYPVTAVTAIY
jgi:flagellar basal-body rod modification protein FlgD